MFRLRNYDAQKPVATEQGNVLRLRRYERRNSQRNQPLRFCGTLESHEPLRWAILICWMRTEISDETRLSRRSIRWT
jgi:hypothetical protein